MIVHPGCKLCVIMMMLILLMYQSPNIMIHHGWAILCILLSATTVDDDSYLLLNRHHDIRLVLATLPSQRCSHLLRHHITTFTLALPPHPFYANAPGARKTTIQALWACSRWDLGRHAFQRFEWGIWNASLVPLSGGQEQQRAHKNLPQMRRAPPLPRHETE